jgi:hypothetical protein
MIGAGIFSLIFILIENFALENMNDGTFQLWGISGTISYWNIIKFVGVVFLTSSSWIFVTLITRPVSDKTLRSFYQKIRPGGPGWKPVVDRAKAEGIDIEKTGNLKWDVPTGILCMLLGSICIYSILFAIGNLLYGKLWLTILLFVITVIATLLLWKSWKKLKSVS